MKTETSLTADAIDSVVGRLRDANHALAKRTPGESSRRQPVHTVYGGAHLFAFDTAPRLGALALRALHQYAPDFVSFARALDLPCSRGLPSDVSGVLALREEIVETPEIARVKHPAVWLAHAIHSRVVSKLEREAVEDLRIDFEDGYGNRPDAEEDAHAVSTALEVAKGLDAGTLAPFLGIRIKPLTEELRHRSFRTLDLFLTALAGATGGRLPHNFVVTLPKVTLREQTAALADVLDLLEDKLGLPAGAIPFELMIETTQAVIDHRGQVPIPRLIEASRGRCIAAHLGTYDYTAACNVTAAHQHMAHPACDFAKHVMQVSLAGSGIWLSDGATNVMPVGPHRGETLTPEQVDENMATVHAAWRLHYGHVRHSLISAYYQGWDLHPAQLPSRYAAVYAFFLESLEAASQRLSNFIQKAAQATMVGDVFDDAATGQGLLNFFLRGINCGAIREEEALATGVTLEELRGRSFVKILNNRRGGAA